MDSTPDDAGLDAWRRQELIRTLRWLAAEPDAAIAAVDDIVTADEIALDLDGWLEGTRDRPVIDEVTASMLQVINDEFTAMTNGDAGLWTDDAIRQSPEWARQRERARATLVHLGESRADAELGRVREGGPVYVRSGRPSRNKVDPRRLRKAAVNLWFAVERMQRGNPEHPLPPPFPDDDRGDELSGSGVPRRPAPTGGAAAAAAPEDDAE